VSGYISITDFGANGDGKTDSRAAIQKAFDYAKANGKDVFIPAGTFVHSGTLTADGIKVFGSGDKSILKAGAYGKEAVYLKGDGVELSDLHLIGVGGKRLSSDDSQKIVVAGATHFAIERVHIEGTTTGGMKFNGAAYGRVADNVVEKTHADSIHMTSGSHDIVVERNKVMYSGDDGIAVVSYGGSSGKYSHDITIVDNEVLYNAWGRGITVVGGTDVLIDHNNIVGGANDRAGIYIAAESSYNTQAVHNVSVTGNTITDAGGASSGHGAITVYNSQSMTNDGITIAANDIINPRKAGVLVTGSGAQNIALYDNTLAGGKDGLLENNGSKSTVSTAQPSTEKNILGTDAENQFPASENADVIYARGGNDTLHGKGGNDLLAGGAGNDGLTGGRGEDRLDGGDGNDVIDGSAGDDSLRGGAGNDTFVFGGGSKDVITDFMAGEDKIDLSAFGLGDMTQLAAAAKEVSTGANTMSIDFGAGGRLDIYGIGKLAAENVVF
jgi:Ca2+-binding RTX toxin-like protein